MGVSLAPYQVWTKHTAHAHFAKLGWTQLYSHGWASWHNLSRNTQFTKHHFQGANSYGQLGLGHKEDALLPSECMSSERDPACCPVQVAGGGGHTIILTSVFSIKQVFIKGPILIFLQRMEMCSRVGGTKVVSWVRAMILRRMSPNCWK